MNFSKSKIKIISLLFILLVGLSFGFTAHALNSDPADLTDDYGGIPIPGVTDDGTGNPGDGGGQVELEKTDNTLAGWIVWYVGLMINTIASWFMWLAAAFLNFTVYIGITRMGAIIQSSEGIAAGWKIFRDLLNIFMIFGLLYVAITTIVWGWSENGKKRLSGIIMAALLINFSFFFTSLAIDLSNTLTLSFYDNMGSCVVENNDGLTYDDVGSGKGLSDCFLNETGLISTFDIKRIDPTENGFWSDRMGQIEVAGEAVQMNNFTMGKYFILSGIFIGIGAIVFFILAFTIFARFLALIFLLITSPVMFGGAVLPKLKEYTDKWVGSLTNHLVALPVMFIFVFISFKLVSDESFMGAETSILKKSGSGSSDPQSWAQIASEDAEAQSGTFGLIMNYTIAMGFLVGSIIVGRTMGGSAGEKATKFAAGRAGRLAFGAGGKLGRGTLGRVGREGLAGKTMKDWANKGNIAQRLVCRAAVKSGNFLGKSSFDARNTGAAKALAGKAGIDLGKGSKDSYSKQLAAETKAIAQNEKELNSMTDDQIKDEARKEAAKSGEYNGLKAEYDTQTASSITEEKEIKEMEAKYQEMLATGSGGGKKASASQRAALEQQRKVIGDRKTKLIEMKEKAKASQKKMEEIERKAAEKVIKRAGSNYDPGVLGRVPGIGRLSRKGSARKAAAKKRVDQLYKSQAEKDKEAQNDLLKEMKKANELAAKNASSGNSSSSKN